MNKLLIVILSVLLIFSMVTGCGGSSSNNKPTIVATLFPQYDFARTIAGDDYNVVLLLKPGTESHTYDPSPADIFTISSAALFVYTGDEMEPWAAALTQSLGSDCPPLVDCSSGITMLESEHHEEEADHDHAVDPHIWLDLRNSVTMCDTICAALCELDPAGSAGYIERCAALKAELLALDSEFEQLFVSASDSTIVFGGRFSYIYFIERYALDYVTVYETCSASVDPSLADIARVVDYINENSVKAIYHEELTDPVVARSIAEDTGVQLLEFSTGHNVTQEQLDSGITFIDVMRRNLENLRKGLN